MLRDFRVPDGVSPEDMDANGDGEVLAVLNLQVGAAAGGGSGGGGAGSAHSVDGGSRGVAWTGRCTL